MRRPLRRREVYARALLGSTTSIATAIEDTPIKIRCCSEMLVGDNALGTETLAGQLSAGLFSSETCNFTVLNGGDDAT